MNEQAAESGKGPEAEVVAEYAGEYREIVKPEVEQASGNPFEGYKLVKHLPILREKAFLAFANRIAEDRATIGPGHDTYILWNQRTGVMYESELSSGPLHHSATQRNKGFRRYVASGWQETPGVARTFEELHRYHTRTEVREDAHFDEEADYLGAVDRISPPFELARPLPQIERPVMEAIITSTESAESFERIVRHLPVHPGQADWLARGHGRPQWESAPFNRIPLSGPTREEEMIGFVRSMQDRANGDTKATPEAAPEVEPRFELLQFTGRLETIPGLPDCQWAALTVGNAYPDKEKYLEDMARALGSGCRILKEGVRGEIWLLVPFQTRLGA